MAQIERGRLLGCAHGAFAWGLIFELRAERREAVLQEFTELEAGKRDVIVPAEIVIGSEKYIVTALPDSAFAGKDVEEIRFDRKIVLSRFGRACFASSHATAIEIPNSVGDIDDMAFYVCSRLTRLMVRSTNPHFVFEGGCC